jgi:pyruvate-ferredoxin/flavodoxin oxidoreductase
MYREIRFRSLRDANPDRAEQFLEQARREAKEKYSYFKYLADRT